MNAQVNNAVQAGLLETMRADAAKVIAGLKAQRKGGDAARKDRETAVSTVREMALHVSAIDGSERAAKAAATYLAATMKAAGIADGTAKPYALALRGFIYEAAAGKDIIRYTDKGEGKWNPLAVADAQKIARRAEMTEAERQQADEETERLAIVADLSKRLKAMGRAELVALRDSGLIPEVETEGEAEESAADRRKREAAEKAKREQAEAEAALAAIAGETETVEATAQAA